MRRLFYVVVALQMLFLLGEAGRAQLILMRSPVVTLKVVPVDPRSLFMGNYMALAYDISTIDLHAVSYAEPDERYRSGSIVYVQLDTNEPYASVRSVLLSPPLEEDLPYLRGRIVYRDDHSIRVEYGLERYFIPETKQEEVNKLQWGWRERRPEITAEVAIKDGKGLIRRILVDGKPLGF